MSQSLNSPTYIFFAFVSHMMQAVSFENGQDLLNVC